jgi:hypothetical protein
LEEHIPKNFSAAILLKSYILRLILILLLKVFFSTVHHFIFAFIHKTVCE